jgi:uncharacterized membrane protein
MNIVDKKLIDKDNMHQFMAHNISKMHFQQNMCFQLRNWAFGVSGIVMTVTAVADATLFIKIFVHIISILLLGLILHKDLSWHRYAFKYEKRARLCERCLLGEEDMENFTKKYLNIEELKRSECLLAAFRPKYFFTLRNDYIEIYLIILLLGSMFFTMMIQS